jgi:ParB-like nuclease domain
MKFQLKEIHPNPFRRIEKYPIRKDKVAELKESINAVGFWEGVPVRINEKGKPELVFGHHRLAALKELYSGTEEFNWNVVKYSDAQMIQAMARENSATYSTSVSIIMESIKSAVEAYAQGKIKSEEMPMDPSTNKQHIIHAPSFAANTLQARMERPGRVLDNQLGYPGTSLTDGNRQGSPADTGLGRSSLSAVRSARRPSVGPEGMRLARMAG